MIWRGSAIPKLWLNSGRCRAVPVIVGPSRAIVPLASPNASGGIVSIRQGFTARKGKVKETFDIDQLPSRGIGQDGNTLPPLPPLAQSAAGTKNRKNGKNTTTNIAHPSSSSDASTDTGNIDAQYREAVSRGVLPDTPLAKEVFNYWQLYPDAILLMRVGKFYESYFEPAISFANTLSLKLAYKQYSNGVYPFSGFPVTQLDKYLKILAEDLGRAVVVVEEYDEEGRREALNPIKKYTSAAGDLKDRRVGRVVTPGTLVEDSWLSGNESRYLLALAIGLENGADTEVSLAYTDASTGEFFLKDTTAEYLEDELVRIAPREAVLDAQLKAVWQAAEKQSSGACREVLETLRVLGVHVSFADPYTAPSIEGLAQHSPPNRSANLDVVAVAILRHHLQYALRDLTPDLTEPDRRSTRDTMLIDAATISALEIRHAIRPGGLPGVRGGDFGSSSLLSTRGTLLSTMAKTQTPGGHRLLIRTLTAPSTNIAIINRRLDMVETLVQNQELRLELRDMLHPLMDVMRLVQRFRGRRGDGRDAWETARWIKAINQVRERIRQESVLLPDSIKPLMEFAERLRPLEDLVAVIEGAIDEVALNKGYMDDPEVEEMLEAANEVEMDAEIADAKAKGSRKVSKKEMEERRKVDAEAAKWWMQPEFDEDLAAAHKLKGDLAVKQAAMQADLRKKLKVDTVRLVKIRNTYMVQSSTKLDYAVLDKSRRLVPISESKGGKSYVYNQWTALGNQLDRLEETMTTAQRRAFDRLRDIIAERSEEIQRNASLVDELDLCLSFAQTAEEHGYVRPVLDDSTDLDIVAGRHPTVESSLLSTSRSFTPNTTTMNSNAYLHIITGPNQGGKSTILRQTAVIAILAQSGSFVPADYARLGIVDKVFSRIGSRDDLFRDRSTFMLEMVETAAILRHASERSLVIMDEIGRGTTLHSGLSIAYATLNHILCDIKCRTLFATHYHEVAEMLTTDDKVRDGVQFWCTDVAESDGGFSYQYQLRPGINRKSHAIKAAILAGMPPSFIQTATDTLKALTAGIQPRVIAPPP